MSYVALDEVNDTLVYFSMFGGILTSGMKDRPFTPDVSA